MIVMESYLKVNDCVLMIKVFVIMWDNIISLYRIVLLFILSIIYVILCYVGVRFFIYKELSIDRYFILWNFSLVVVCNWLSKFLVGGCGLDESGIVLV